MKNATVGLMTKALFLCVLVNAGLKSGVSWKNQKTGF